MLATLMTACYQGNFAAVRSYLAQPTNPLDLYKYTPTTVAINQVKHTFATPLDAALQGACHPEIIRLLLEKQFSACYGKHGDFTPALKAIINNKTAPIDYLNEAIVLLTNADLTQEQPDAFSQFLPQCALHECIRLAPGFVIAAAMTNDPMFEKLSNYKAGQIPIFDQVYCMVGTDIENCFSKIESKPFILTLRRNLKKLEEAKLLSPERYAALTTALAKTDRSETTLLKTCIELVEVNSELKEANRQLKMMLANKKGSAALDNSGAAPAATNGVGLFNK